MPASPVARLFHSLHAAQRAIDRARRLIYLTQGDQGAPAMEALDVATVHLADIGQALERREQPQPQEAKP